MRLLELFSGTHSVGKVAHNLNIHVTSLDRDLGATHGDYTSSCHIKTDIMNWDYKTFPENSFDIITASPVCLWWSCLRKTWIGRKCKSIHSTEIITKEHLINDIEKYGKPMVDKVFEIIKYFKPKYYWIENPQTGSMKDYIASEYPEFNKYYDLDYCKYSYWGYQKRTRFWTNIENFTPKICKKDCENIVINNNQKIHFTRMGSSKTIIDNGKIIRCNTKALRQKYKDFKNISHNDDRPTKLDRYRIPPNLIKELLNKCN